MVVSVLSQEVTFVIKSIDSSPSTYVYGDFMHSLNGHEIGPGSYHSCNKMPCRNMRYEWIAL